MNSWNSIEGISIGSNAPVFDKKDVEGNTIELTELLKKFSGVLIDFFRGAW